MSEFVKGWDIVEVLGEGAFGEVQLLINRQTNEAVAVKVVNLQKHAEAANNFKKEICIHRMLDNTYIIKYFGSRKDGNLQSIFLEYAPNGELFDRIEPDVGMPQVEAHKYFSQLLAGVKYLHEKGVAHRDLKPENLLLDEHDNLKISDFGMATMFKYKNVERKLARRCGTIPYIAPEVLFHEYSAQPADIWSCGIILVALLAGELPWDKPTCDCQEYADWKQTKIVKTPWSKIGNLALSLLRRILMPNLTRRYTIEQIESHRWFKAFSPKSSFSNTLSGCNESCGTPMKRFCSGIINNSLLAEDSLHGFSASQPPTLGHDAHDKDLSCVNKENNHVVAEGVWFSQPARPENMLLSSQLQATQPTASQGPMQRLVKRLTRFFVSTSAHDTIKELKAAFDKLGFSWKLVSPGQITITTQDRRKMQLIFKTSIIEMNDKILVDFRLSRGDGIEFKRKFIQIRNIVCEIVVKGPVMWPVAIATNSIPK